MLTRHFHVWPDYHGNRSPLADPTTCGMVAALSPVIAVFYYTVDCALVRPAEYYTDRRPHSTVHRRDLTFPVAAACIWNSLP